MSKIYIRCKEYIKRDSKIFPITYDRSYSDGEILYFDENTIIKKFVFNNDVDKYSTYIKRFIFDI